MVKPKKYACLVFVLALSFLVHANSFGFFNNGANFKNENSTGYQIIHSSLSYNYSNNSLFFKKKFQPFLNPKPQQIKLKVENHNLAVGLKWSRYTGFNVNNYSIYRSENNKAFRVIKTLKSPNFIDSSVTCGAQYRYIIKANEKNGNKIEWSDTPKVVAFDTISPERPDINQVSVIKTSENKGKIELKFDGILQPDRKAYTLYKARAGYPFQPYDTIYTNQIQSGSYNDMDLNTANNNYKYYIRSLDSCRNFSKPSDTHRTIFLNVDSTMGYNELSWNFYKGWSNSNYEIQRREGNNPWDVFLKTDSLKQINDTNVNCQSTYTYRILGEEKGTSYSVFSNNAQASPRCNEGTNKIKAIPRIQSLALYPNPTSEKINLRFRVINSLLKIKLELLNVFGKTIYKEELNNLNKQVEKSISLSDQSKGVYFLRLSTQEGEINKRFVLE